MLGDAIHLRRRQIRCECLKWARSFSSLAAFHSSLTECAPTNRAISLTNHTIGTVRLSKIVRSNVNKCHKHSRSPDRRTLYFVFNAICKYAIEKRSAYQRECSLFIAHGVWVQFCEYYALCCCWLVLLLLLLLLLHPRGDCSLVPCRTLLDVRL